MIVASSRTGGTSGAGTAAAGAGTAAGAEVGANPRLGGATGSVCFLAARFFCFVNASFRYFTSFFLSLSFCKMFSNKLFISLSISVLSIDAASMFSLNCPSSAIPNFCDMLS